MMEEADKSSAADAAEESTPTTTTTKKTETTTETTETTTETTTESSTEAATTTATATTSTATTDSTGSSGSTEESQTNAKDIVSPSFSNRLYNMFWGRSDSTMSTKSQTDESANNDTTTKGRTPPHMSDIPGLIEAMLHETGQKRADACTRIYELCDVAHKVNRIPMVCEGTDDVLTPLANCLKSDISRHVACLALNNLSIPMENKRVMAFGPASREIISGLTRVIAEQKQETHLCCICLLNLSMLPESIPVLLRPTDPDDKAHVPAPLENPSSLLRALETLLLQADDTAPASSTYKSEHVRWACGLIKVLAQNTENCALLAQTKIPQRVVDFVRASSLPPSNWPTNCLEDFSLSCILHIAEYDDDGNSISTSTSTSTSTTDNQNNENDNDNDDDDTKKPRRAFANNKTGAEAIQVVAPIMAPMGGLQRLKASMACAFLGAPWSLFPREGKNPCVTSMAELLEKVVAQTNSSSSITNNKKKHRKSGGGGIAGSGGSSSSSSSSSKKHHQGAAFPLRTVVKAYRNLAFAAAKADADAEHDQNSNSSNNNRYSNLELLARPPIVALLLSLVSDVILVSEAKEEAEEEDEANNNNNNGSSGAAADTASKFVIDFWSAEFALGALEAMLPALLDAGEGMPRTSFYSEKASAELCEMLTAYTTVVKGVSSHAKILALNVSERIKGASGHGCPNLETSYELWTSLVDGKA